MILRNHALRLGNVQIWVVPPCYVDNLQMLRNWVLKQKKKFRYVLCRSVRSSIADSHEFYFQVAKSLNKSSTILQDVRFANAQESRVEAWKRLHMGCATLICLRFADVHEFRFKLEKSSDMGCAVLQGVLLTDSTNGIIRQRNVCIRAVPSYKMVDLLMLRNRVFRLPNVQIWVVESC